MNAVKQEDFKYLDQCNVIPLSAVNACYRPEHDEIISREPLAFPYSKVWDEYAAITDEFTVRASQNKEHDSIIVSIYSRQSRYRYGLHFCMDSSITGYLIGESPIVVMKVFGNNWNRVVEWVNEYLSFGRMEDALNPDSHHAAYIK